LPLSAPGDSFIPSSPDAAGLELLRPAGNVSLAPCVVTCSPGRSPLFCLAGVSGLAGAIPRAVLGADGAHKQRPTDSVGVILAVLNVPRYDSSMIRVVTYHKISIYVYDEQGDATTCHTVTSAGQAGLSRSRS